MTCHEGLENYPNNPRLKELAKRLSKPQISSQQVDGGKADPLPMEIITKLQDLRDKNEANLLLKKCFELVEKYNKSALLWHFVGCAHLTKGQSIQAEAAFRKVIELDPTNFAAHTNLGNALKDLERFKEAEEMHKIARNLNPLIASPQINLGSVYEELARYEDSFECFSKAVSLDPECSLAKYNLGAANLRVKNFVEGWRLRETRWLGGASIEGCDPIKTSKPLWDGSSVDRLYVWSEQGIGDEVMFASCFDDLTEKCNQLIVACSPRLRTLFQRSFQNKIEFVDREKGLCDEDFDFQVPAQTATGLVRQNLEDFNLAAPAYLNPDPIVVENVRQSLERMSDGRPIIGLSWLSKNDRFGKKRSISLSELVSAIPKDYMLVNLQYGDVKDDLRTVQKKLKRSVATFDDIDNWKDLDLFAGLIQACDKVVSIDNSTVHFAGALDKECHVLLPISTDWRWGLQNETSSYWYNSLVLHRQLALNDWSGAITSLTSTLGKNSPSVH
uniref:Predicted TPR domain protein n=1 Tax=uncultured bacterium BAC17H8 TaxID=332980 RepID=Q4JMQ3_9BACT|nr:predicted TPR domain protein [uncultured bacterium BAC17H8]